MRRSKSRRRFYHGVVLLFLYLKISPQFLHLIDCKRDFFLGDDYTHIDDLKR